MRGARCGGLPIAKEPVWEAADRSSGEGPGHVCVLVPELQTALSATTHLTAVHESLIDLAHSRGP